MKYLALIVSLTLLFILVCGCEKQDVEINRIQNQIDSYIALHLDELNEHDCYLVEFRGLVITKCDFALPGPYNETHDVAHFYYESSGGTKSSYDFFLPHFEPLKLPMNTTLTNEGNQKNPKYKIIKK